MTDGIIDIAIQICLIGWSPCIRNDTYGIYECTRVVRAYQERDSPWPYFRSYRPARYYLTRYRSCLWMKPVVVAAPSNCSWRPYHLCSLLAQLYVGLIPRARASYRITNISADIPSIYSPRFHRSCQKRKSMNIEHLTIQILNVEFTGKTGDPNHLFPVSSYLNDLFILK